VKFVKPSQFAELVKAGGLPMGAVRMYKNGEWFRKVGGAKGWEYVGKQGGAKAKKSIIDAMKMFNVGGKCVELFEKRWDYIVKHKELPRYRVGDGGFMNPADNDESLQRIAR